MTTDHASRKPADQRSPPCPFPKDEVTALLRAWNRGEEGAEEAAMELIYPHLRRIAAKQFGRHSSSPPTLQVTELVHETYMKFKRSSSHTDWNDRTHFFNFMAKAMRRLLIDLARKRSAEKRCPPESRLRNLDESEGVLIHPDLLDLDRALHELSRLDPSAATVVELRYFAGLSVEETAALLGIGRTTTVRRWRFAKSWLGSRLEAHHP